MTVLADLVVVLAALAMILRIAGAVVVAATRLLDRSTALTAAAVRLVQTLRTARRELSRRGSREPRLEPPRRSPAAARQNR